MYKTTDPQDLKLKREIGEWNECVIEIITPIAMHNLIQIFISGMPVDEASLTPSFLLIC